MKLFKQPGSKVWFFDHSVKGRRFRESTGTTDARVAKRLAKQKVVEIEERYAVSRESVLLSNAIKAFVQNCKQNDLSANTVRGYEGRLARFLAFNGDADLAEWFDDVALDKVTAFFDSRMGSGAVRSYRSDRLALSAFFNFLRSKRWYRGENPADAKLHGLRRPRRQLRLRRTTTPAEDLILRRDGRRVRVWPIILLARWAGMRRGEACCLRWCEVDLTKGYADVAGHNFGRKHPRRVWLADWVTLQLRDMRSNWLPEDEVWPLWPHHPDTASDDFAEFCDKYLDRRLTFNALRASWVTEVFGLGMTPIEEARLAGHSPEVAERYYSEYDARAARVKLPPDPLTTGTKEGTAEVRGESEASTS